MHIGGCRRWPWSRVLLLGGTVVGLGCVWRAAPPVGGEVALALTGVTVVDVADGRLLPQQTVVIAGNRIRAVGPRREVRVPAGARVIVARGKYLIPGLWDMHTHIGAFIGAPVPVALQDVFVEHMYTLLLANGVTGYRDAGTAVPLDSLVRWRRAIWAGTRVGPPRQLLTGPHLDEHPTGKVEAHQLNVRSLADVLRAADSLLVAGADQIKLHDFASASLYHSPLLDSAVAELRHRKVLFGGHLTVVDSGARFLDHGFGLHGTCVPWSNPAPDSDEPSVERCTPLAAQLRRNDMWVVSDAGFRSRQRAYAAVAPYLSPQKQATLRSAWKLTLNQPDSEVRNPDFRQDIIQRAGVPILVGTDCPLSREMEVLVGFALHGGLEGLVWYGLTPLAALQAVTLNPARALHATDSLGTVAPGKLADLVLLDANPLADIRNTMAIRAVVANGRYFDRLALDSLLRAGVDGLWPPSESSP